MSIIYLFLAIGWLLRNSALELIDAIALLVFSLNAGLWFFRLFDYLLIDENGFQYNTFGTVYSGQWSDVQRLAHRGIYEGVYIPIVRLTSGGNRSTRQELFVPLSLFIPKWQESILRQRINEYVLQTKSRILEY